MEIAALQSGHSRNQAFPTAYPDMAFHHLCQFMFTNTLGPLEESFIGCIL